MRLQVREALQAPGESFAFEQQAVWQDVEVGTETLTFIDPVLLVGEMTAYGDRVRVTAKLTARLQAECARCLETANIEVSAKVDETFVKEPDPETPDARVYDGLVLELDDMAEEAIRLELPIRFLCSPKCKGICQSCGKNLNLHDCACKQDANEDKNPFSALAALLPKEEE